MEARVANADALSAELGAELERRSGTDLVALLHDHDVPCALVNEPHQVHLDPQVQHNQTLVEHVRPWLGTVREPRPPALYSTTPTSLGRHAPKLDEHTDEILRGIGCDDGEIAALRASGAAGSRRG